MAVSQGFQQYELLLLEWIAVILQNYTGFIGSPFGGPTTGSPVPGKDTNHSVLPASPVEARLAALQNRQFSSQATAGGFVDAQTVFNEATTGSSIANSDKQAEAVKYNAILNFLKSKNQRLKTLQTKIEIQKLQATHSPQHAVPATDWKMSVNNMVDGLQQSRNPTLDFPMILGLERTLELDDVLSKMQAQVDLLQSQVHDGRNLMEAEEPKQSSHLASKNTSLADRRLVATPEQQQSQTEAQVGFAASALLTSAINAATSTKFNVDARISNIAAVELIKDQIVDEVANFERTRIQAMTDAQSLTKKRGPAGPSRELSRARAKPSRAKAKPGPARPGPGPSQAKRTKAGALGAERSLLEGERKHLRGVQAEPRDVFDNDAAVHQPAPQPVQPQAFGQPSWRDVALALVVIYLALQVRVTTQSLRSIEAMLQQQLDCANSNARKQADAPGMKDGRTEGSCFCNNSASEDSD